MTFNGAYDAATGTVRLAWEAPATGSWSYELYRGDVLLTQGSAVSYIDSTPANVNLYALRATDSSGKILERTIAVQTIVCEPVVIWIYTHWPFVEWGIRDECLEP